VRMHTRVDPQVRGTSRRPGRAEWFARLPTILPFQLAPSKSGKYSRPLDETFESWIPYAYGVCQAYGELIRRQGLNFEYIARW
jgi:hypothetical protein